MVQEGRGDAIEQCSGGGRGACLRFDQRHPLGAGRQAERSLAEARGNVAGGEARDFGGVAVAPSRALGVLPLGEALGHARFGTLGGALGAGLALLRDGIGAALQGRERVERGTAGLTQPEGGIGAERDARVPAIGGAARTVQAAAPAAVMRKQRPRTRESHNSRRPEAGGLRARRKASVRSRRMRIVPFTHCAPGPFSGAHRGHKNRRDARKRPKTTGDGNARGINGLAEACRRKGAAFRGRTTDW
jgi:hypothetical protein